MTSGVGQVACNLTSYILQMGERILSILRRYDPNNRPVFLTCVTADRQPILTALHRPLIVAYRNTQNMRADILAWVIMPDHLHAVIELGDYSLSDTVHRFKRNLSSICYRQNRRGRIWQHRFWDHIIRDQTDLNRHIDYIHFNPVKHGLADKPIDWKWSSIHWWMAQGWYQPDWGCVKCENSSGFGE